MLKKPKYTFGWPKYIYLPIETTLNTVILFIHKLREM
jgi:hypothetical protein